MANLRFLPSPIQATAYLLFIMLAVALTTTTTTSAARILVDEHPIDPTADSSLSPLPATSIPPTTTTTTQTTPSSPAVTATGTTTGGSGGGVGTVDPDHTLTFFMHDILGGSNPTTRAVTGVVNNPAINGQVPFAKPNGAVLPVNNGVSQNNNNNGVINNNNLPFLTGLGGTSASVMQNNNNNNNNGNNNGFNNFAINGGQLPTGSALAQLMFGTINVIDDELTEGHELGSQLLGKAQGYYVASSLDGTSQAMAFTAMFQSGHYEDSLNFFGVHRAGVSESQLAVMGGTGKYVNAKGYAVVKTINPGGQGNHETDGIETLLEFAVYVTY